MLFRVTEIKSRDEMLEYLIVFVGKGKRARNIQVKDEHCARVFHETKASYFVALLESDRVRSLDQNESQHSAGMDVVEIILQRTSEEKYSKRVSEQAVDVELDNWLKRGTARLLAEFETASSPFNPEHENMDIMSRRIQNINTKIGKLADETLSEIFGIAIDLYRSESFFDAQFGWRLLLAICSRWRTILIDTASFWSTIWLDWSPELVQLFATRSRQHLLNILTHSAISPKDVRGTNAAKLIGSNTSRIRSLKVLWQGYYTEPPFDGFVGIRPLLEDGYYPGEQTSFYPHLNQATFVLRNSPDIIIETIEIQAPDLTHLHLENVLFSTGSWTFLNQLTDLHLKFELCLSSQDVVYILARIPQLKSCIIKTVYDGSPSSIFSTLSPGRIVMASLECFEINHLDWPSVRDVMSHLSIPATTSIKLVMTWLMEVGPADTRVVLAPVIAPRIQLYDTLELNDRIDRLLLKSTDRPGYLDISLYDWCQSEGDPVLVSMFEFISRSLLIVEHLLSLTLVDLPRDPDRRPSVFHGVFEALPNLLSLSVLRCEDASDVFVGFRSEVGILKCPRLTHVDLRNSYCPPEFLLEFVRNRRSRGARIQWLRMTEGTCSPSIAWDIRIEVGKLLEVPRDQPNVVYQWFNSSSSLRSRFWGDLLSGTEGEKNSRKFWVRLYRLYLMSLRDTLWWGLLSIYQLLASIKARGPPNPPPVTRATLRHSPFKRLDISQVFSDRPNGNLLLRRAHNFATGIGKLADETLSEIFGMVIEMHNTTESSAFGLQWRFLLFICSRWRTVIIETASFWSAIWFDWHPSLAQLFASRSRNHALKLHTILSISHKDVLCAHASELIASNASRITCLGIVWVGSGTEITEDGFPIRVTTLNKFMSQKQAASFPRLTEATFASRDLLRDEEILDVHAPELRHLHLQSVQLNAESWSVLTQLTDLRLECGGSLKNEDILYILEKVSHLRSCIIVTESDFLEGPIRPPSSPGRIDMKSLETLTIDQLDWPIIRDIVVHLIIPPTARVELVLRWEGEEEVDVIFAPLIAPRVQFQDTLKVTPETVTLTSRDEPGSFDVRVHEWCCHEDQYLTEAVLDFISDSPTIFQHLVVLILVKFPETPDDPQELLLQSAIRVLTNLREICVLRSEDADRVILAFKSERLLCPHLARLRLQDSLYSLDSLFEFVRDRRLRGAMIQRLEIDVGVDDHARVSLIRSEVGELVEA
ncbi:hypothetical protein SISNIDRAFT_467660 [Sistotremastrum niveocremeum HHB9708]|uniref:F-box domain-containing protein n=1 Tax=Sistotremastrum niveocremeum HHB9708 TaxID=1314777 RepID=A0A164SES5_9AGAM|nr:hypothetical protein SISNIDRAFT_467660 [Sistotremastrum niveocremeum HHB9708]